MSAWAPKSIDRCLRCHKPWGEVAYRNRGLCVACHNAAEGTPGRLEMWAIVWQGHRKLGNGRRNRDAWVGVLDIILEHLPASTIEQELELAPNTVRGWYYERGTVPFRYRIELVELAKRAPLWRWDEEERSA